MKAFIRTILTAILFSGLTTVALAGTPRHRFQCDLAQGQSDRGYQVFQFFGFIYPATQEINMTYTLTDPRGKSIASGDLETSYKQSAESLSLAVPRADGIISTLKISKDLLTVPATKARGDFDGSKLSCFLLYTHLPSSAASLPKSEFEKYNLPVSLDGNLPVKTWTSSDRLFQLNVSLIKDYINKKGKLVTGWTSLKISFLGAVIDDVKDVSRYVHYVQSGSEKRVLHTVLKNQSDVQKIISIFQSNKVSLDLVHHIGGTTAVNLQIDCTSQTACLITSKN